MSFNNLLLAVALTVLWPLVLMGVLAAAEWLERRTLTGREGAPRGPGRGARGGGRLPATAARPGAAPAPAGPRAAGGVLHRAARPLGAAAVRRRLHRRQHPGRRGRRGPRRPPRCSGSGRRRLAGGAGAGGGGWGGWSAGPWSSATAGCWPCPRSSST